MVHYDELTISFKKVGLEWEITTCNHEHFFYGLDVKSDTITVKGEWLDADGNPQLDTVCPSKIILACDYIGLYFHPHSLAKDYESVGSEVTGTLKNGDTFKASGPGWDWRHKPKNMRAHSRYR
jgi:hypothetical protein